MHSFRKASVYIQQSRIEVNGAPSPVIGGVWIRALLRRNDREADFDVPNASTFQRIDDRTDKLIIVAKDARATAPGHGQTCASSSRANRHEFAACNQEVELILNPQRVDREPKGMHSTLGRGKATGVIAVLVLAGGLLGWTQYVSRGGGQLTRQGGSGDTYNPNPEFEAKRVRALNADRHKVMVSDAEKLVKLAQQLDAEIASNPTDELTPEELRKLETIEKLAHTVKTKMAESFGGGPELKPILPPPRGLEEQ